MKKLVVLLVLAILVVVQLSQDAQASSLKACLVESNGKIVIKKRCNLARGFQEITSEVLQGIGASQVGPQGPQGPAGPRGPAGAPAVKYFAVVFESGTIRRSEGATRAERVAEGSYRVYFDSDIRSCIALAGVGRDNLLLIPAMVSTTVNTTIGDHVRVRIMRADGTAFDRDFYLAILC